MPGYVPDPPPQMFELARSVTAPAADVRDFLQRCKACGLPVDTHIEQHNADVQFCQAFCDNFSPPTT